MQAKGVIRKQVQWSESRSFFYWRLKRLLLEYNYINNIASLQNSIKEKRQIETKKIKEYYILIVGIDSSQWSNDKDMINWYESTIGKEHMSNYIQNQKNNIISNKLIDLLSQLQSNTSNASTTSNQDLLNQVLTQVPHEIKQDLIKCLQKV